MLYSDKSIHCIASFSYPLVCMSFRHIQCNCIELASLQNICSYWLLLAYLFVLTEIEKHQSVSQHPVECLLYVALINLVYSQREHTVLFPAFTRNKLSDAVFLMLANSLKVHLAFTVLRNL